LSWGSAACAASTSSKPPTTWAGSCAGSPSCPASASGDGVVNYRKIQIDKLRNVEFIPGKELTAQAVVEYGAEIVVVATGAHWATDGLNGCSHDTIPGADASLAHCLTPEQIMVDGKQVPGSRVVVVDNDGYFMGVSIAEKLAMEGKKVTLVTHFSQISPYSTFTLEAPRLNRLLRELGVELVAEHAVERIEPGLVTGSHVYAPGKRVEWAADAAVLVTQRVSNDALYRELWADRERLTAAGITGLFRIGDCVVPRLVADAIFDGHRLAREIDSGDPATPLPFIRENRVLGARDEDYDAVLRRKRA